mgnify:CR=1 FL=1
MLQATKNKYGIETLKELNVLYDREHWLTQEDVDMANRYVELIERTRSEITPQIGDRLIFLSRHGDYYANALIDSADEKKGLLSICEQPYVPFVWQAADNIRLCVSGGAFHHIKKDELKFNGWTEGFGLSKAKSLRVFGKIFRASLAVFSRKALHNPARNGKAGKKLKKRLYEL